MKQTIDHAGLAVIGFLVERYNLQDLLVALADVATVRGQETGDSRLQTVSTAIYCLQAELTATRSGGSRPDKGQASYLESPGC